MSISGCSQYESASFLLSCRRRRRRLLVRFYWNSGSNNKNNNNNSASNNHSGSNNNYVREQQQQWAFAAATARSTVIRSHAVIRSYVCVRDLYGALAPAQSSLHSTIAVTHRTTSFARVRVVSCKRTGWKALYYTPVEHTRKEKRNNHN